MSTALELYDVVGIDISHWRPVADYEKVAKQIYFVQCKATDGQKTVDETFRPNWYGFKEHGRARQAMHFVRFYHDARKAKNQAEHFVATLEAAGGPGELYPCLDVEKWSFVEDVSKMEAQDFIWKLCFNVGELLGISQEDVSVYTNASTWNERVAIYPNATDIPRHRPLSVASWKSYPPTIPWDWYQRYGGNCWTFWQWTSLWEIDGIAEGRLVDGQVFNGNLAKFNLEFNLNMQPLGQVPPPEPPPPPADPTRIEIVGLDDDETLRIRTGPWGTTVGKTWNDAEFEVVKAVADAEGRLWYYIGPEICVASWYTG